MAIIIFILILCVLILVHEFGHFFTAKLFGMRVDEFGIGYPPKAKTLFKKGETVYTLNWIPFGGFVKIFGENSEGELADPRNFTQKPWYAQAIVLIAGVFMNFMLAWILFSATFLVGLPTSLSDERLSKYAEDKKVLVVDVLPESPAQKSGIVAGDQVLSIKGSEQLISSINSTEEIINFVQEQKGSELQVTVRHGIEVKTISVVPEINQEKKSFQLGISLDSVGTVQLPLGRALQEGFITTAGFTKVITTSFVHLIRDAFRGSADVSNLSGPIGIVRVVGDAYQFGFVHLLSLTSLISLNLVVLNLIPFPALDGGRLFFVLIEAITRRKIPTKFTNIVNSVGFLCLILLMLFVTYKDILKLVK